MLSICITVKNRSLVRVDNNELRLFPNCVRSIVSAMRDDIPMELIVADWGSDDWPLDQWLHAAASPIPIRVVTMSGVFSRGRGLNMAAQTARGNIIFFLDADMLVSRKFLCRGDEVARQGKVHFPIVFAFNDPRHQSGSWNEYGYGNCALRKQVFEQIGGWPEYQSWGGEDDDFYARASECAPVVRERVAGFYHQWHPTSLNFKNRYGVQTAAIRRRRDKEEREGQVVDRLRSILPGGSHYILVDEDRTDIRDGLPGEAIPFLERDHQYWGPPADDAQAIFELERLRSRGAQFIVFPWVSFWWLEHYARWVAHLDTTARRTAKDGLVVVYDLQRSSK
jgi:glycosyltransferase involved in cell wall biosynthesis